MIFQRTELLIGNENLEKLKKSHILVFGVGGVGGFSVEGLVRAGVGEITVVDFDTVDITNLNRQIIATQNTLGENKVDVIKERAMSINPEIKINTHNIKFFKEHKDIIFNNKKYDFIIDAVDIVTAKIDIIMIAKEKNINIISSMGTGNKLNPTLFEIADISKTSVCPLARTMRNELKKRKVQKVKVLFSKEVPMKPENLENNREKKNNVGSISFVPSVAGLIIAGEVINTLIGKRK